jgi:hypothetical protein
MLVGLFMPGGQGATLTVETKTIPGLTARSSIVSHTIRLSGPIEEGDARKLRTILERLKRGSLPAPGRPLATLELSSQGGDLYEGFKLGYLLREFNVATVVRARDLCLSACALAFLGGTASHAGPDFTPSRSIEIGGQVGFHNFTLNPDSEALPKPRDGRDGLAKGFSVGRGGTAALVRYAASMGVDTSFIALLLSNPADRWEYIDSDGSFVTLRTCPIGLGLPPISPPAIAANICNHATGWFNPASPTQARSVTTRDAKQHLLEHVQRNIEAFPVKGPLVAQLKAVIASRDAQLIDSVYNDLRNAGVALPEVFGTSFEVAGYSIGEFELQCHVSFRREQPDRFELVLVGPKGLLKSTRSPPAACPGLFFYDRDDIINPRRR